MSAQPTLGMARDPEAAPTLLPAPMGDRPPRRPGKPGVPPSSRDSRLPGPNSPGSAWPAARCLPPGRRLPLPSALASSEPASAEPATGGDGGPAGAGGAGTGNPRPLPGLGGRGGARRGGAGAGDGLRLRCPRAGPAPHSGARHPGAPLAGARGSRLTVVAQPRPLPDWSSYLPATRPPAGSFALGLVSYLDIITTAGYTPAIAMRLISRDNGLNSSRSSPSRFQENDGDDKGLRER